MCYIISNLQLSKGTYLFALEEKSESDLCSSLVGKYCIHTPGRDSVTKIINFFSNPLVETIRPIMDLQIFSFTRRYIVGKYMTIRAVL